MRSSMACGSPKAAIHAAVFLSHRYITDRNLPDKAIDLIDEAASLIRMQLGQPAPSDRPKGTGAVEFDRQAGGAEP